MPHTCNAENALPCDCNIDEHAKNSSLCEYPNGPTAHGIQRRAKAYPGLRHLEVLKGIGNNAIVASICPKNVEPAPGLMPANDPSYGYNPAVASILDIFRERLEGNACRASSTSTRDEASPSFGKVSCSVIEAVRTQGDCSCDPTKGRAPVSSKDLRAGAKDGLRELRACGGDTKVDCNSYCLCEVEQLRRRKARRLPRRLDGPGPLRLLLRRRRPRHRQSGPRRALRSQQEAQAPLGRRRPPGERLDHAHGLPRRAL